MIEFRRWGTIRSLFAVAAAILGTVSPPIHAQDGFFQPIGSGDAGPVPVQSSAVFTPPSDGKPGLMFVTAKVLPGWHIYSVTQPPGATVRTKIKVDASPNYRVGEFTAVEKPHAEASPEFNNIILESHTGTVTWYAALEVNPGIDVGKLEIRGAVFAQACEKVCVMPQDYGFTAKLGAAPIEATNLKPKPVPAVAAAVQAGPAVGSVSTGPPKPGAAAMSAAGGPPIPGSALGGPPMPGAMSKFLEPAGGSSTAAAGSLGVYTPKLSKVKIEGKLEPAVVAPGETAKLVVTATPEASWHVYYAIASPLPTLGNQATSLVFSETSGLQGGFLATAQPPVTAHLGETSSIPYYEQPVTWTVDVTVPADAKPGDYLLAGSLGFQTCQGSNCLQPEAVKFETTLVVAAGGNAASSKPLAFVGPESYRTHVKAFNQQVAQTAAAASAGDYDIAQIKRIEGEERSSLPWMLVTAMLAGFILNFMPCVLPVIGLKVLSFVEQGGHDPRRIFALNAWYSLGMIAVFWVLATIPVVLRIGFGQTFGWGEQFSYDGFNITLIAIVFVMALSFLGVWEIPIPGFAGSKGATQAASQEGAWGAFAKGAITTVLATPCSGPFLGTAVAFALRESAPVTYAIFTAMGLGMAAPYLLVGIRPSLIRFLPKPGEWMDTFKQIMGFVLIGTALWLLVPVASSKLLPTMTLLAGLAAGCWWIGRTPSYAETHQKIKAWGAGLALSAVVGWFAFAAPQVTEPLPWKTFAMNEFIRDVDSDKTVLIEFTADWCLTCKTLKAANLDRSTTKKTVQQNGVVTYEVNIDEVSPLERQFFERLQPSKAVPLVAIFPAGRKYEPILFGEGYTQSQILDALNKAGPSKNGEDSRLSMR
ncbi:MAG: thioredoxin family protein [Planctomycetaceae bacterium]|nr:thioredoxin family protein [Planctomycetaceae bacterium]